MTGKATLMRTCRGQRQWLAGGDEVDKWSKSVNIRAVGESDDDVGRRGNGMRGRWTGLEIGDLCVSLVEEKEDPEIRVDRGS